MQNYDVTGITDKSNIGFLNVFRNVTWKLPITCSLIASILYIILHKTQHTRYY